MNEKMKAIIWDGGEYPGSLTYGDFDIPEPGPGWVLVNTKAVGICGSDTQALMGNIRNLIPKGNYPSILGHENAGIVVKAGEGVTKVKCGDRVAVEPLHGCIEFGGSCPMCRVGRYQLCQSGLVHVGVPLVKMLPGGYGEYSIVHETRLFHLPEEVSIDEAALLDILAVNVHAANIGKPSMGDTVVVIGCGVVGLNMIQLLRANGITDIIGIAKYEFQAAVAKHLGAKETIILDPGVDPVFEVMKLTERYGVNQVYECVGGKADTINQAISICSKGGQIIMIGGPEGSREINLQAMQRKELSILSSNSYSTYKTKREFQIALNMLRDKQIDHKCLITNKFAPEDFRRAFDLVMSKGGNNIIKALFIRD